MTDLNHDLSILAADLGIDPAQLRAFAAEDTLGGYNPDPKLSKFPVGSLWEVEGKVLYALCRALKPDTVVEIGTHRGASATHILRALQRNEHGMLVTIDVNPSTGDLIPDELKEHCSQLHGLGHEVIRQMVADGASAQIVFEDASHGTEHVEQILRASLPLRPRIILSHDAMHPLVGPDVRTGWNRVFASDYKTFLSHPSDCGFAYKTFA
ncbi:MAG: class I SAM-dependent methyltransferase [Gammaproteobacteria bacterium]|nr:class I SAM-dependent methyltransferase [Gammaproteobacteria bacterium]